jgi:hypothetical protein
VELLKRLTALEDDSRTGFLARRESGQVESKDFCLFGRTEMHLARE